MARGEFFYFAKCMAIDTIALNEDTSASRLSFNMQNMQMSNLQIRVSTLLIIPLSIIIFNQGQDC